MSAALLLAPFLIGYFAEAFGQSPSLDISVADSDAAVMIDETGFWVESENRARWVTHRVIRINNERGKKYGEVGIAENKYLKSRYISARIKDVNGKVLRELREKEIFDAPSFPGYVLYSDDRTRWFELKWNAFPYLIEYAYEVELKSLFFWPEWLPQEEIPVLKSTYKLVVNEEISYRTHARGIETRPGVSERKGKKEIVWELTNVPAKLTEDRMPPENETQMALFFAPVDFNLGSYKGSFTSWDAVADWYLGLSSKRYQLPPEAQEQVRQLVAGVQDDREKLQRLYRFLQNYTRYVAIHLGIGSWQPHSAEEVFKNRYGDCKDLTTLMIGMLKEAGIASYPVLVRTRDEGTVIKEFPSNQFNHCITFVPLQRDTFWLDCTADFLSPFELPRNVEGCEVLVVKEDGGEILRTPQSRSDENPWRSKLEGTLSPSGALQCSGMVSAGGNEAHFLREKLSSLKPDEQRDWLAARLGRYLPKLDLQEFAFHRLDKEYDHPLEIKFTCLVKKFGVESGTRIFVNPNVLNRVSSGDIPKEKRRRFPVYLGHPFREVDSVILSIPEYFELEAAPDSASVWLPFGGYRLSYSVANGKLLYQRELEFTQSQIPVDQYETYLGFLKTIVKNDQTSFVFVKK